MPGASHLSRPGAAQRSFHHWLLRGGEAARLQWEGLLLGVLGHWGLAQLRERKGCVLQSDSWYNLCTHYGGVVS